jgi:RND family efflux transporter MFP subunit
MNIKQNWYARLKASGAWRPTLLLVAGAGLTAALFMWTPTPATKDDKSHIIQVEAMRVTKAPVTMTVEAQGEVLARTRTNLVAEVSGVIRDITPGFVAGGAFQQGDLLVAIDNRNYVAEVERARANVAGARTELAEEQGLGQYAAADWQRTKAATKPTELALRKPQIAEAQAKLAFAEADLARKQGDLARTRVLAPYVGLVESRLVDVGQYVSPGTALGVVFAADVFEVRLPLPLHELTYLDLPEAMTGDQQPVPALLTSIVLGEDHAWPAQIVRTEAVMDRKNRVLYAIAEVQAPYTGHPAPLRVGNYVRARIEGRTFDDIARIPRAALRPGNKVWLISAANTLTSRTIKPIRAIADVLYVAEGIDAGDIVLLTPLENPLPGTEVKYTLVPDTANNDPLMGSATDE